MATYNNLDKVKGRRSLLLLRSYGDFVVLISSYQNRNENSFYDKIIASAHLHPLYEAIKAHSHNLQLPEVDFIDFGIRHHILSIFTNRFFLSGASLKEVTNVRKYLNEYSAYLGNIWLEQKKRARLFNLLMATKAHFVHNGIQNIYKAYADFWGKELGPSSIKNSQSGKKILILPGSRKKEKRLPLSLVNKIKTTNQGEVQKITVAGLADEMKDYDGNIYNISSFDDLITLILENDFIHCADSLSAHLCELYNKPHRVYYRKAVNSAWATPNGIAVAI